jgi:uncharacterized protein involved in exopolysaccharide biosynthesis
MGETFYPRIDAPSAVPAQRDWLAVGFRHRHLIALSFGGIFTSAVLTALLLPPRYQANTKILVKHERVDPLVTPEASNAVPQIPLGPTETELGSEMVLLKSQDLLEAVVTKCGLENVTSRSGWRSWFPPFWGEREPKKVLAIAEHDLEGALKVELLPKTNLISVTYEDSNPQRAAQVLHTLVDLYMEKHLAVHRPPGTFEFFQQQTQQHSQSLEEAESRVVDFSQKEGAVSPGQQKTATLEKLAEFQSDLERTQVSVAETEKRIRVLEEQAQAIPLRMTTQVRTADNPQLIEQLNSTLLNLQLKRTELLQKFEPTYRPVQEVDAEIAQTQAAIDATKKLRDETTDRNPISEWVNSELTKARSQLAAEQTRAQELSRAVRSYQERASNLDRKEVVQQRLVRDQKVNEANYLLYLRKQEEARISDALDRRRIVNVAVAEAAAVPAVPSRSRGMALLMGLIAAIAGSLAAAAAAEHLNPSLRTSDEVEKLLDVSVLALVSTRGGLDATDESALSRTTRRGSAASGEPTEAGMGEEPVNGNRSSAGVILDDPKSGRGFPGA